MEEQEPNQESNLDPRAVPVAIASVLVIAIGVLLTYANTTIGAIVVLLGLGGVVWLGRIVMKQSPAE